MRESGEEVLKFEIGFSQASPPLLAWWKALPAVFVAAHFAATATAQLGLTDLARLVKVAGNGRKGPLAGAHAAPQELAKLQ